MYVYTYLLLQFSSLCQVLGVDYSGRFLDAALQLSQGREVRYVSSSSSSSSGGGTERVATLPAGVDASKVVFKQVKRACVRVFLHVPKAFLGEDKHLP